MIFIHLVFESLERNGVIFIHLILESLERNGVILIHLGFESLERNGVIFIHLILESLERNGVILIHLGFESLERNGVIFIHLVFESLERNGVIFLHFSHRSLSFSQELFLGCLKHFLHFLLLLSLLRCHGVSPLQRDLMLLYQVSPSLLLLPQSRGCISLNLVEISSVLYSSLITLLLSCLECCSDSTHTFLR